MLNRAALSSRAVSTLSPSRPLAEPAAASNMRVGAIIVLLVIVAAVFSAWRKDVTQGFDEVAHASYVAHIQASGDAWPALEAMRMLDPATFRFTAAPNYLNHPSPYYALLAALGPRLEGHPDAILVHRFLNIAMAALALAALLTIGVQTFSSAETFYAYAVPLAAVPVLIPLAGAINNDNAAFLGGALTLLGAWQLVATGRTTWLMLALAGVIVAAWAKLTGLMLAGGTLAIVMLWLLWRRRFEERWLSPLVVAALIAATPYIVLTLHYGSPTPNTAGQLALLRDGAAVTGWDKAERLGPFAYAAYFSACFLLEWMPTLSDRNALNYAALALPVAAGLIALAGVVLSLRRITRRIEGPCDVVIVAGALAFAATFVVHIAFSYQRHLAFGWMMDAYPRYYLPLIAIVPFAGLSVLDAIEDARARRILLGFLVAGPIAFRLIAAPLG